MNAPLPGQLMPELQLRPVPPALLQALTDRFGDRCSTAAAHFSCSTDLPRPAKPPTMR